MRNTGRTGGRRTGAILASFLAAIFVLPAGAGAQDMAGAPDGDDMSAAPSVELTAYAGAILPMSLLGSQGDSIQAELSTKPAFGASLEFWFGGGFGLGVGGGVASPNLTLTTVDSDTGDQDEIGLGSSDHLHGEALVLWRPELRRSAASVLPYFGIGAGVRRLAFDDPDFEDTTDPTIVLNAGTHLRLSETVHLRLDLRDLISSFEGGPFESSDTQHDLVARVGVGIGL
ncbi:MAG: hypothetical protein ACODAB_10035 [Gemmatimonadota bacterium]